MSPTLQIKLFGDFCLTDRQQANVKITSERSQALLAYLVLHHGTPQPRQRLAFYFWAESTESQARANLRKELHYLRRSLPLIDSFLLTDGKTLQWQSDTPFTVDVIEFEQAIKTAEQSTDQQVIRAALEAAARLYRSPLLPGCNDEWILPERERLQQTAVRALEWLVQLLEAQQDYRTAIGYAQQLLRLDPFSEATYRGLMRLHLLNDNRPAALQLYHQCLTMLREELGVDPSPSTRKLYQQLLADDQTEIEPPKRFAGPDWSASLPVGTGTPAPLPLVGRQNEWLAIQQWIAAGQGASAEVLLLVGETGIGKTRLLEELRSAILAAEGCVLWGRGFEAEMVRPYGAWIDGLRTVAASHKVQFPEDLGFLMAQTGTAAQPADRIRLFDAVVQLLAQLAADHGPVAIILDDIQWLDEASTALLHYAIRLLGNSTILFACAARPMDLPANQPVSKVVQALRREQRLRTLALTPLDQQQTAALICASTPDEEHLQQAVMQRVFAESGGNPLFILEIVRSLSQSDTAHADNLESLIQDRLLQLEESTRELLPWAAALGRSFSLSTLALIANCNLARLLAAVEQLEHQGIIRPGTLNGELGYDFAHDIVRQVAYRQLSEPRRCLLHLQIAQTLYQQSMTDGALAGDIAHHAALGGNDLLAAEAALLAAQRGLKLFAFADAAELAQRGIHSCHRLQDRSRIHFHVNLLKVLVLTGVTKDQLAQLEIELHQLISESSRLGLQDEEAVAREALIALHYDHGNLISVHEHSLRAAERGRTASPTTTARMLAYTGWCLAEIERDMTRAEALLLEAQSLAARAGQEIMDIQCGLGIVRYYAADWVSARSLLEQAWRMAHVAQDHWRKCICLKYLAMVELEAGNPAVAMHYSQEMAIVAAQMDETGSEEAMATALTLLAQYAANPEGDQMALEQVVSRLYQLDNQRMCAYTLIEAAAIDLQQNRVELAMARAESGLVKARVVGHLSGIALAWGILVQALLTVGDLERAAIEFEQLRQQIDHHTISARAHAAIQQLMSALKFNRTPKLTVMSKSEPMVQPILCSSNSY